MHEDQSRNRIAQLAGMVILVLAVTSIAALAVDASPPAAPTSATSPAEATMSAWPTLYYFYAPEVCRLRHCRQAELVSAELGTGPT